MRASMSAFLPAPSTMVVSSLSTVTRFARPRSFSVDLLELDAELLGDDLAAGEDGDVLQHLLAAIAEAGRLHRADVERAAELVHDERRERLALDVLGDDEERLARAGDLLEERDEVRHRRDLPLGDEEVRVLEHRLHPLGVRDEVGRDVAAVELHPLDHVERRLEPLRLLDRDDALLARPSPSPRR